MRLIIALAFILAGCAATPATPTPTPSAPQSLWGEVLTLGQAELADAPAILTDAQHITAAWINATDAGIAHEVRLLGEESSGENTLPLVMTHPYHLQLLPAGESGFHLLWLDSDPANPDDGSRLYTAHITGDLTPERGPILASEQRTLRFATVANADGSVWAVWSGGLLAEPSLYMQYIDSLSRPRSAQLVTNAADWPALIRAADGTVYVFWLWGERVYRAVLGDGIIRDKQVIAPTVPLEPGDHLTGFDAAQDNGGLYLFWNLVRADGSPETWYAYGAANTAWDSPKPLRIGWTTKNTLETGFNSGPAYPAFAGDHAAKWTTPAAGQADRLALAAQVDNELALIYLQNGDIVGYQAIIKLQNALIGYPALRIDRNRYLILAWSEPTLNGYADLNLTTTRSLP